MCNNRKHRNSLRKLLLKSKAPDTTIGRFVSTKCTEIPKPICTIQICIYYSFNQRAWFVCTTDRPDLPIVFSHNKNNQKEKKKKRKRNSSLSRDLRSIRVCYTCTSGLPLWFPGSLILYSQLIVERDSASFYVETSVCTQQDIGRTLLGRVNDNGDVRQVTRQTFEAADCLDRWKTKATAPNVVSGRCDHGWFM